MNTLYNTARCVNTAWYINMGLHRVTIYIHMFSKSYELSTSVNISQRYNTANLTHMCGYLDVITVSRMVYTPADRARNELKCIAWLSPVYAQCGARKIRWEVSLSL
jgi:hypothetical protein